MAHAKQRQFCEYVRDKFPNKFFNKIVLDCGSLDINGNNRYLFTKCNYTGVDIIAGKNVDVISEVHKLSYCPEVFDVIISTEMIEHDKYYQLSLKKMIELLFLGGLLFFTCATEGRQEHGTTDKHPACSPGTLDYYKNITEQDIRKCINVDKIFKEYEFKVNTDICDLYFWGIKK